jgi:hypothetical protein
MKNIALNEIGMTDTEFNDQMRRWTVGSAVSGGWVIMRSYHDLAVAWCKRHRLPWKFTVTFHGGLPVVTRVR